MVESLDAASSLASVLSLLDVDGSPLVLSVVVVASLVDVVASLVGCGVDVEVSSLVVPFEVDDDVVALVVSALLVDVVASVSLLGVAAHASDTTNDPAIVARRSEPTSKTMPVL